MKCPRAKLANHCLTELFSIYQKNIGPSDGGTIISLSHRLTVIYIRDWLILCLWVHFLSFWEELLRMTGLAGPLFFCALYYITKMKWPKMNIPTSKDCHSKISAIEPDLIKFQKARHSTIHTYRKKIIARTNTLTLVWGMWFLGSSWDGKLTF